MQEFRYERFSRLSAAPGFLRDSRLWGGFFGRVPDRHAPSLADAARGSLSSHRWGLRAPPGTERRPPDARTRTVISIALGLLERGDWTLPTWGVECELADRTARVTGHSAVRGQMSTAVDGLEVLEPTLLIPARLPSETSCKEIAEQICSRTDPASPAERDFVRNIAGPALGSLLLNFLQPQRGMETLAPGSELAAGRRVDFALETPKGHRLVIEIHGGQHGTALERGYDESREAELKDAGWGYYSVQSSELGDADRLREELRSRVAESSPRNPDWGWHLDEQPARPIEQLEVVWGATIIARTQALVLEAMDVGLVSSSGSVRVGVREADGTGLAGVALDDLTKWASELWSLYGLDTPPRFESTSVADADLVVDITVLGAQQPDPEFPSKIVAWSRPAGFDAGANRRSFGTGADPVYLENSPHEETLAFFLRWLFRKEEFREGQSMILQRALGGRDVLALLPTGAGKSLPYQLAALLAGGLTLYVSPLKSLLQDQWSGLRRQGVDVADYVSGAMTAEEKQATQNLARRGGLRILMIAPERLLMPKFLDLLNRYQAFWGPITQVVIDECHCVSEWGHEFRPAYLSLGRMSRDRTTRMGTSAPLVALTGTASSIVLADVQRELGIDDPEAVIRARNLDRPELRLVVRASETTPKKLEDLADLTEAWLNDALPTDGLLVFCPFKGLLGGVYSAYVRLLRVVPSSDIRFYVGGDGPDWGSFAAFALRRKKDRLTESAVREAIPTWASPKTNADKKWSHQLAIVQENFISGTADSFRVLVATNAFGMGIDKPSIRKVVHLAAPASPESYYQEVGRAGRDRIASEAVLFFSDAAAEVSDQMLSPSTSLDEARRLYSEYVDKNKFGGGDFIGSFVFHVSTYEGREDDVATVLEQLQSLHTRLDAGGEMLVPMPSDEKQAEYALIRLMNLGILDHYHNHYRERRFELSPSPAWVKVRRDAVALRGFLATAFEKHVGRYLLSRPEDDTRAILNADAPGDAERAAVDALIGFMYEHVERRRRQASRQMLELARTGVRSEREFRDRLLSYLQVSLRFTSALEALASDSPPEQWLDILETVESPQDLGELHGAVQRVLESYPTHPGLLFIAAVSRQPGDADGEDRSYEEFSACLERTAGGRGRTDPERVFNAATEFCTKSNRSVLKVVRRLHGMYAVGAGHLRRAAAFVDIPQVREQWLRTVIKNHLDRVQEEL